MSKGDTTTRGHPVGWASEQGACQHRPLLTTSPTDRVSCCLHEEGALTAYRFLPPLSASERDALRASIIESKGLRPDGAIIMDENGAVLDGHHRKELAEELGFSVSAQVYQVDGRNATEGEKQAFVYQANIARRNLSPDQTREVLTGMKNVAALLHAEGKNQKQIAAQMGVSQGTVSQWIRSIINGNTGLRGRNNSHRESFVIEQWRAKLGGRSEQRLDSGIYVDIITSDRVFEVEELRQWRHGLHQVLDYAGETGLQPGLILFGEEYGQKAEAKMLAIERMCAQAQCQLILDIFPRVRLPGADTRVKVSKEGKAKIAGRIVAGETQVQVAADYHISQRHVSRIFRAAVKEEERKQRLVAIAESVAAVDEHVLVGDFRAHAASIPDGSVSLIFTDPPYDRKASLMLPDLGAFAAAKLVEGGSLLCYVGQTQLPTALDAFREHLRYWWTIAIVHETGHFTVMREYGVNACWKAMLWFVKSTRADKVTVVNDVLSGGREKTHDPWQQAEPEAAYWIEKLCPPEGIVCDPFLGGGTTAMAAAKLQRHWVGMEIDPQKALIISARLRERLSP